MTKRSFHDVRNTKKALEYGVNRGMGVFRSKPPKKTNVKEQKSKTDKE